MSKISRIAEFAASAWILFGAIIGTWALKDFFSAAPLAATASYMVTEGIIVLGALWHIRRAVRGR